MKKVLVIEGGGADGLYVIGLLKHLIEDKGEKYDAIFGTSIGGVIGLGLSYFVTTLGDWTSAVNQLEIAMGSLSWRDLVSWPYVFFFFKGGFLRNRIPTAFADKVGNCLMIELEIPTFVFTTDIDSKISPVCNINSSVDIASAAGMTANIPGVFGYFKHPQSGHRCFDGGIACNNSIATAIDMSRNLGWEDKDTEYTIIRMSPYKPNKSFFLSIAQNLLNLFYISRVTCEELSLKLSRLYKQIAELKGEVFNLKIFVINKSVGLLKFNPKENGKIIQEGYDYAKDEKWNYSDNTNG